MHQSAIHQLLGADFDQLPAEVRAAHDHDGALTLRGLAQCRIGKGLPRRLVVAAVGLPRDGADQPVTVILETNANGVDFWRRDFAGRRYQSHLSAGQGRWAGKLVERQGALTNIFTLSATPDRLNLELRGFAFLGVCLPRFLSPRCTAYEAVEEGLFVFDIVVDVPLLGRLIHYRGALAERARDYP